MKGFGIEVKNNLLDPKHVRSMGPAVWLYMWYLDKLTSVNENGIGTVLGGRPITFELVAEELGCSDKTYRRWVDTLRSVGYINTLRAPSGLVTTVNKAHKPFRHKGSVKSDRSYRENSDRSETTDPNSDRSQMAEGSVKSADPNKTLSLRDNKTVQDNIKILSASPKFDDGKPDLRNHEINQLVEHFEKRIGKMPRTAYQRRAAQTLLQRHGFERTIGAINAVVASRGEQYAPSISTLVSLRDKWVDLETFYKRLSNKKGGLKIV